MWVECECAVPQKQRNNDSLSQFGPISTGFVNGEVIGVVWPLWRIQSFGELENKRKLEHMMQP